MFGSAGQLPGLMSAVSPADDRVADLQAKGRQDVALLAVKIVQQGDEGGAVGIVLDGGDLGRDIHLVALEVNDAVLDLVAAALVADGDLALRVAAGILLLGLQRGPFPALVLVISS